MNNNKLKILHTPVRFYPYMGGIEHSTYFLCKYLIAKGYDVSVICANEDKSGIDNIDNIKIKRLPYIGKITNTNITLTLPFILFTHDFDIIHTYMPTPWSADWSILIAKIRGKKSVISIKNDLKHYGFLNNIISKIYINTFFRISLSLTNKILVVNPDWKNAFTNTTHILRKYENKIEIVPNGLDLELFYPQKRKNVNNKVLFISVLKKTHRYKGLDYLLKAFKKVVDNIKDAKLIIIGEGELKEEFRRLADFLNITQNVTFVGNQLQKNLVGYFNQSNVFVLPSTEIEGFGNVLLESMACEIPVITTYIVGMSQQIREFNAGVIIPPKNIDKLSDTIISILKDKKNARKMGKNGNKLVHEKYTWDIIADLVSNIYKSI